MEETRDATDEIARQLYSPSPNDDGVWQWYWVKATYKAVHVGAPRKRHLWERMVFLVLGPGGSAETSMGRSTDPYLHEKAERVARDKEHEYVAAGGDTIRWTFQRIEDIQPIFDRDIADGTEVYWELFERVDKSAG